MTSAQAPKRIAVIGGGISGLAAAHRVTELAASAGAPAIELVLFEAAQRLGGVMGTDYRDGYVLEHGPDSFISEKPWALALSERLGMTENLVRTNDQFRRNFVVHDGELHALPDGFLMMAPTRFLPLVQSRLFSWPGKLRMGFDLVLPRGPERSDESLGSFVRRRLGQEALERVVQPLVGGIYTADPEHLSLAATMPRFLEMERKQRSIIAAMWSQMRRANAGHTSGARWSLFVSVDRGMQGLVDAITRRLPPGFARLGVDVRAVTRSEGGSSWQIDTGKELVQADAVIVAAPAPHAARVLRSLSPEIAHELEGIAYASSATVSLAFRRSEIANPLDGFGFVVPHIERRGIIACTYTSVKYPGRAPEGGVLLRAFVGGALQEELVERDDAELVAIVRSELRSLLGITAEPVLTNIHRHTRAMPQYRVGHLDRMARIDKELVRNPGLYLAGNAYRGVGVPDCIHSGETAAEQAVAALPR